MNFPEFEPDLEHAFPAPGYEIGMVTLKPHDTVPEREHIVWLTERMINNSGLDVILTHERTLSDTDVVRLYQSIFEDRGEESDWVDNYRRDLVNYMTSGPILIYLLGGINTEDKTDKIKQEIRALLGDDFESLKLKNFVHSPDRGELDNDLEILLGVVQIGKCNED